MNKINIDDKWLILQYVDKYRSLKDISDEIGCSRQRLIQQLNKLGIKTGQRPEKNLLGESFGEYIVIKYHKSSRWLCKCSCGTTKIYSGKALLCGKPKSCGCKFYGKNHPHWKGYEEISGHYYSTVRCRARRKNIKFNVSIKYLWNLFISQNRKCALSGTDLHFKDKNKKATASLDRINNNKGYVKGNLQWVHKTINVLKNSHTQQELFNWCKLLLHTQGYTILDP